MFEDRSRVWPHPHPARYLPTQPIVTHIQNPDTEKLYDLLIDASPDLVMADVKRIEEFRVCPFGKIKMEMIVRYVDVLCQF